MKVGMVTGAAPLGYGAYIFEQKPTGILSIDHVIVIGKKTFEAAEKALKEYAAENPGIEVRNLKTQKTNDKKTFVKRRGKKKEKNRGWRMNP